jgi:hypothetical protein
LEIDPVAGEDLLLAIQGQVIRELRHGNVGEEARPWPALLDRARREGSSDDPFLTRPTRVFDAGDLTDEELRRNVLELFGLLLPDRFHVPAAATDPLLRRRVNFFSLSGKICGKGPSAVPPATLRPRSGRLKRDFLRERLAFNLTLRFVRKLKKGESELSGRKPLRASTEDTAYEIFDALLEELVLEKE